MPIEGGLPICWNGADTPPGIDLADVWWRDLAVLDSATAAPDWADAQRQYARQLRSVGQWWLRERLLGREFGGGLGDDVELAALFVPSITWPHPGPLRKSSPSSKALARS